jgi:hypothetical protein
VVLNGILQTGGSSFNIVNDTIVFAEALTSSDVINQILVLGNVNDIGVPSSDSVGSSHIQDDSISDEHLDITAITGQTAITSLADTDKFLVSDASDSGNLKYVENQYLGGGTLVPISSVALSGNTNPVRFDNVFTSTYTLYQVHLSDLTPQSDGVSVRFRWRNGSSTLEASGTYEHCSTTVQSDSSSATIKSVNNDDNIQIGRDGFGHSAARSGINGIIQVHSPQATGNYKSMHYDLKSADSDGFTLFCSQGTGAFKDDTSTTVEGFELTCSSNGFSSGRIDIYGVKQV